MDNSETGVLRCRVPVCCRNRSLPLNLAKQCPQRTAVSSVGAWHFNNTILWFAIRKGSCTLTLMVSAMPSEPRKAILRVFWCAATPFVMLIYSVFYYTSLSFLVYKCVAFGVMFCFMQHLSGPVVVFSTVDKRCKLPRMRRRGKGALPKSLLQKIRKRSL